MSGIERKKIRIYCTEFKSCEWNKKRIWIEWMQEKKTIFLSFFFCCFTMIRFKNPWHVNRGVGCNNSFLVTSFTTEREFTFECMMYAEMIHKYIMILCDCFHFSLIMMMICTRLIYIFNSWKLIISTINFISIVVFVKKKWNIHVVGSEKLFN